MEKELKRAFYKAKYKPSSISTENIWQNIVLREKRIVRIKSWVFSFTGFVSLIALIPAWKTLSTDLTQSGVYEYLSLAFSNGSSVFAYWKEFVLSIAESLPVMSIVLSLSLVFVFLLSLKFATKQIIFRNQLSLSI